MDYIEEFNKLQKITIISNFKPLDLVLIISIW